MKRLLLLFSIVSVVSCSNTPTKEFHSNSVEITQVEARDNESVAYFASGCFWCVEEVFESIKGVREVVSGYAGGTEKNPTYKEVSAGRTSHAESVKIFYDPSVVSFDVLVDAFFASHDPTTLNRQGPDAGKQYRSIAFYSNSTEKAIIEEKIAKLEANKVWSNPIVTQVQAIGTFWPAEDYHQDYIEHNPDNPYVQSVSIPRFNRFKEKFDKRLLK